MSKLEKRLVEWVAEDLIHIAQANDIRKYEAAKTENNWVLLGLLMLGVSATGIGAIAVIAANWNQIPDFLKLSTDFILLTLCAFVILHSWKTKKMLRFEATLFFFLILCLASIGLIAQIYHTSGKLYQALLLWSLITASAAFMARQFFIPFAWIGVFLISIVFATVDFISLAGNSPQIFLGVLIAMPLFCGFLALLSKRWSKKTNWAQALNVWVLLSCIAVLDVTNLPREFIGDDLFFQSLWAYIPADSLAILTALGIWYNHAFNRVQKSLLLFITLLFLLPFHLLFIGITSSIVYAICRIVVLGLMAIFLASLKKQKSFQALLLLISLEFIGIYLRAFGGLALTGGGLIVSGIIIIGLAALWNKYRTTLAVLTEKWVQNAN